MSLLIDDIWVDTGERTFSIEGIIKGTFALDDEEALTVELPHTVGESVGFAFTSSRR